jgi:transcriptional regulator with XRE-family HTH domain
VIDEASSGEDPKAREEARVERIRHDGRFGRAAARVREKARLRQEDVPGVSARQVRRIEAGAFPRVATLAKLAAAHGLDSRAYLDRIALELREHDRAAMPTTDLSTSR